MASAPPNAPSSTNTNNIVVRGARTHNLKNIDVDIPHDRLTVLTGPSGSGKSSLAFDTLHAEGQRRYLETLRTDTRALFQQLQRPDADLIDGLPPTLCVSQHTGSTQRRSTLATITEIHDYLRLLWARLGTPHCLTCGQSISKQTLADIVRTTLALEEGRKIYLLAPLVRNQPGDHRDKFLYIRQEGFLRARVDDVLQEIRDVPHIDPDKPHTIELVVDRLVVRPGIEDRLTDSLQTTIKHGLGRVIVTDIDDGDWHDNAFSTQLSCPRCDTFFPELEPRRFSFNSPYGACKTCTGLGQVWEVDPARLIPDRSLKLEEVLDRLRQQTEDELPLAIPDRKIAGQFAKLFPHPTDKKWTAVSPLRDWPEAAMDALLHGSDQTTPPWSGWLDSLRELGKDIDADPGTRQLLQSLAGFLPCPECHGSRLNAEARAVTFADKRLPDVTALTVEAAHAFFEQLRQQEMSNISTSETRLGGQRVRPVLLAEISHRLHFLLEVGLGYLTLDRPAPTLSGGEAQRARLGTHLGGKLTGVCYILDEPTIGLHPRDTQRLITALRSLQTQGNTVVIVEHDEDVIRQADYLIDIGPAAGPDGGQLLAAGTFEEVLHNSASVTAPFLTRNNAPGENAEPATGAGPQLTIHGARHHNLKNLDVSLPLGKLVAITGVSGSGKSSLARDVLLYALRRHLGLLAPTPGEHDRIEGLELLDKVIEVDQKPLGRSSRSSPATYTGVYDEIRKVFAVTRLAKVRGYKANRFSFNVKGGRCEECLGQGSLRVAMQFLPDLTVPCPVCRGQRFNRATLDVQYRGKSIADVLAMPCGEAAEFFVNIPNVHRPLDALVNVGLAYMTLGQPSSTLSGGEAQRVKLAAELARTATGKTLFLLDEPTTGLHFADIANLIRVLKKLAEAGNTVVVIEHHLDLIAHADWIIDLGPEGGEAGGQLLAEGTPATIASTPNSHTGKHLKSHRV